jgi:predicted dehydrogenase
VSGSSAHDQHPRPAGHLSQGQGSHRGTNLIAGYGLTSAPGPAGVSVCCCLRPSLGLSSPRHRARSVPWYSHGDRQTSYGALPGKRLRCRVARQRSDRMTQPDDHPIRWGILATGGIAHAFAHDLALQPDCEVVAVGSRSQASADAFGDEFGVPHRHASYQALVNDPDVDAVYVSTPHPGHHDAALLAINAGKAVLVEKPFAMDAAQAREMIDAARGQGTFLMEAMWTRFLPHIARMREILAAGTLGDVVYLTAEHGQWFAPDPHFRLFAPELGGGALLDLGIYPVSFASLVLGVPTRITAVSHPAFTGVDATTSMIFQYDSGAHAVLTTTLLAASGNPAAIYGTAARIEIDGWFYTPTAFRVIARDGTELERFEEPYEGRGLRGEAAEVGRCLRAGLLESPLLPLDETYTIMQAMDEVRRQIGLSYLPA